MVNLALIGYGYWGKNYLKTIQEIQDVNLRWLYNKHQDLREEEIPKGARFTKDYKQILKDKKTDAVIIATPPSSHYDIAKKFLENEKDVLVEKPITCNSKTAFELYETAKKNLRILMVGHIFVYNPAIKYLKKIIEKEEIGEILYLYFKRASLGPIRKDINSMWNLAPHDISISNFLTGKIPKTISATGASFLKKGIEDVVNINLKYEGGISTFAHVSWIEPIKTREVIVIGDKKTAYFNDIIPNKINIFKGLEREVIEIPLENSPLKEECMHFLKCVQERKKPLTDGYNGYIITKVLECGEKSLKNSGKGEKIIL